HRVVALVQALGAEQVGQPVGGRVELTEGEPGAAAGHHEGDPVGVGTGDLRRVHQRVSQAGRPCLSTWAPICRCMIWSEPSVILQIRVNRQPSVSLVSVAKPMPPWIWMARSNTRFAAFVPRYLTSAVSVRTSWPASARVAQSTVAACAAYRSAAASASRPW